MEWLMAHYKELLEVVAYVIAATSIVVKLTPTPKDDAVFGKVYSFLSKYIALNK